MDGHDDRAAAERRQRADDKRASVARPHADALSRAHAQPVELDPQRLDFAPERLVIQRAAGINDGDAVGPLAGGSGQRFKNIHRLKTYLSGQHLMQSLRRQLRESLTDSPAILA